MQPLTIVLLAAAFVAGALIGWLLRGERRERADAVRQSRLQAQLDSQQSALDRQQRQRDELQQKNDDARHRQRQAERRVQTMREALDEQMSLRRKLEKRTNRLQTQMASEREERKKLSRQLRLVIQRTQAARESARADDDRDVRSASMADDEAAREPAVQEAPAPDNPPAELSPTLDHDTDVRVVRGIGPAMKRELAAHGIRTLAQLAALDDVRVDKLDRELRFPGRIRRERWVEQAREMIGLAEIDG